MKLLQVLTQNITLHKVRSPAIYKRYILVLILLLVSMPAADAQIRPGWDYRDELIQGLENPKDTIYVQDRKKLEKFSEQQKYKDSAVVNYKTKAGVQFHILLASAPFDRSKHKIKPADSFFQVVNGRRQLDYISGNDRIDNRKAYGIDSDFPKKEIKELKIKWGEHWLMIPKTACTNLFEPNFIEAYFSKNKQLLYLYMSGSEGAGSYSVKFVFNKTGYITRLIGTNECMDGFDFLDATGYCSVE